jgi:glycosyltransferase involved in cell wall biosynthesis
MARNSKNSNQKYNIICLSNQLWDFPNWTNKRHVMSRLSKNGHNVLFVDPPINVGRVFLNQIQRGLWGLKRFLTRSKEDSGTIVFTPLNFIPVPKLTSAAHIKKIKKIAKKNFVKNRKTVLWVYHVQISQLKTYLDKLDYDILIYDCVDNYEAFPEEGSFFATNVSKDKLLKQEQALAEKADLVFASAPGLVDKLKEYNPKTYYTPNVGDYKRFKNTLSYKYKIPEEISKIPRPRIGMIGALDQYKFDAALVEKCARENPKYSFILIGPLALKDKNASLKDIGLEGLENVYYLGSRPYEKKKYYMAGFDVDIIPYQLNDYTVGGCFPVKFHDSLAAGLPVVVTDLPAYAPFEEVCYISKNYEQFCENIKRALEEDNKKRISERQKVAQENSWDKKVAQMLSYINEIS